MHHASKRRSPRFLPTCPGCGIWKTRVESAFLCVRRPPVVISRQARSLASCPQSTGSTRCLDLEAAGEKCNDKSIGTKILSLSATTTLLVDEHQLCKSPDCTAGDSNRSKPPRQLSEHGICRDVATFCDLKARRMFNRTPFKGGNECRN